MRPKVISGIRRRFQRLSQSQGQVTHVLLTRSPLIRGASSASPFDLHVLSTPPAFVLSQDQTLRKCLNATPLPKKHCDTSGVSHTPGKGSATNEFNLTKRMSTDIQFNPKESQPDQKAWTEIIGIDNCA